MSSLASFRALTSSTQISCRPAWRKAADVIPLPSLPAYTLPAPSSLWQRAGAASAAGSMCPGTHTWGGGVMSQGWPETKGHTQTWAWLCPRTPEERGWERDPAGMLWQGLGAGERVCLC